MNFIPKESLAGGVPSAKGTLGPMSQPEGNEVESEVPRPIKTSVFDMLGERILSHYDAAKQILAGNMPTPRFAIVYPTYVCNQACPGCEYMEDLTTIHSLMTREQLLHTISQVSAIGCTGLEFCGGGEPTLHPNIEEAILLARRLGISIGLLTNGTKLRGSLLETAVKELSYVRVSMDAGTRETFNRARQPKPGADFDAVVENLQALVARRRELGSKLTVSMKFLVSQLNFGELRQAAELAEEIGVDSLQFKAVRMYGFPLTAEEEDLVEAQIAELKKQYEKLAVVGGTRKLNVDMKCWMSPVQIMIDTLGEVYICCYYRHRRDKHRFGNVFEKPLKDIWYSVEHRQAIDGIEMHECNNLDCRFAVYNRLMYDMMVDDESQLDFI